MSDWSAPRGCPDPSVLAAYVEGTLGHPSRREVEQHVADCPECPVVIAETARFLRTDADEAEGDLDPPSRRPWWRLAIAAAFAALCVMGVVWNDVMKRDPLGRVKEIATQAESRSVEGRLADFDHAPFSRGRSGPKPTADVALRAEAERLQEVDATNARMLHARGVTLLLTGNVPAAIASLESASQKASGDAVIRSDLAVAYITAGRGGDREPLVRAIAVAEEAIALSPDLASAHFNRAIALEHLGHTDAALRAYQRARDLEPQRSAWRDESAARIARLQS